MSAAARLIALAAALESISNGEGAGGLAETERLQAIARAALAGTAEPDEAIDYDGAVKRIEACVREIQILCDHYNLAPEDWLQDEVATAADADVKTAGHCVWTPIEDGVPIYNPGCPDGEEFHLTDGLDLYPFCPYCGDSIETAAPGVGT